MSFIINPFAFAAAGGTGASDNFNRADDASSLGTSSGGQVWSAEAGTWGISSNQGYLPTPTTDARAVVETGLANCTIQVTLATIGNRPGLAFRHIDSGNYLSVFRVGGLGYQLFKRVAGSWTEMHTESMSTANGDVLKLVLNGSSIEFWVNAVLKESLTESANSSGTEHGLYHESGSESARWEDFSVVP